MRMVRIRADGWRLRAVDGGPFRGTCCQHWPVADFSRGMEDSRESTNRLGLRRPIPLSRDAHSRSTRRRYMRLRLARLAGVDRQWMQTREDRPPDVPASRAAGDGAMASRDLDLYSVVDDRMQVAAGWPARAEERKGKKSSTPTNRAQSTKEQPPGHRKTRGRERDREGNRPKIIHRTILRRGDTRMHACESVNETC